MHSSPKDVYRERLHSSPIIPDRDSNYRTPTTTENKSRKLEFNTSGAVSKFKGKIFLTKSTKKETSKKVKCFCKKSNCLKGYCICYSNGEKCSGCECTSCENDINAANEVVNLPLPDHCKCSMSNCMKRYCECFRQGKYCDISCRCQQCCNQRPQAKEDDLLKVNRIRVMISKNRIYMNEELDSEDVYENPTSLRVRRKIKPAKPVEIFEETPRKRRSNVPMQSTKDKTTVKKSKKKFRRSARQVKKKLKVN
jgi:hypothetical protein